MNFLEKNLEELIYENANTEEGLSLLGERGLALYGHTYRQVSLGEYGIADLLNVYTDGKKGFRILVFNVIELKKEILTEKALSQVCRYLTAINKIIRKIEEQDTKNTWYNIISKATLIGNGVSDSLLQMLPVFEDVDVYTYKYELDGLGFYYKNYNNKFEDYKIPNCVMDNFLHPSISTLKQIL